MMYGDYDTNSTQCIPAPTKEYIEYIITLVASAVNVPLHLFVLLAIVSHWNLIKRSVVNIYAGNVVLNGLVASIWGLYTSSRTIASKKWTIEFEEFNSKSDTWVTVIQAIHLNMILVTAGSIGLLINVMRSIQFRLHKTVGGVPNASTDATCEMAEKCSKRDRVRASHKNNPKSWAAFYICVVWLLPAIIAVFAIIFGRCVYECHCSYLHVPVNRSIENCEEVTQDVCSILIPPLSKPYLGAGVGLWIVYIITLVLSLFKTKHDLDKIAQKRCDSVRTFPDGKTSEFTEGSVERDDASRILNEGAGDSTKTITQEEPVNDTDRRSVAIKFNNGKACRKMSGSIFIRSLRRNFKLLVIVLLVYVVASIPLVTVALIDAIGGYPDVNDKEISTSLTILPFLGHAICTVLISVHISGVRSAVRALATALTCRLG